MTERLVDGDPTAPEPRGVLSALARRADEASAPLTREDVFRMWDRLSSLVVPASLAMGDGTKQLIIRTLSMAGAVVMKPKGLDTFLGITIVEDAKLAPGMVELRDIHGRCIRMINLNEPAP